MTTQAKRRVAIAGTGHRGSGTWSRELLDSCGMRIDIVGLFDTNRKRLEVAREAIGNQAPVFNDIQSMFAATRP